MSDHTDQLAGVLTDLGGTADVDQIAAALSDQAGYPISPRRVRSLLGQLDSDRITVAGDQLHLVRPATTSPSEVDEPAVTEVRRAVTIDFETVATQTVDGTQRIPWQVGARRFGLDRDWVQSAETFTAHLQVDDATAELLADHPTAPQAIARHGRSPALVAQQLAGWLADADILIAYNGHEVDLPVLKELCGTDAIDQLAHVDGLYLAYALWPSRHTGQDTGHALDAIARRAGLPVDHSRRHDAQYDADLLADVIAAAAQRLTALDDATRQAICALGRRSSSWQLLAELADLPMQPLERDQARPTVVAALDLPPLRTTAAGRDDGPVAVTVPARLRRDGRIDPGQLAVAGDPDVDVPETRHPQQQMTAYLRQLVAQHDSGLCEAATGTGKTEALLAVVLEWLEADDRNRVIIATYTKQLQRQLAARIQELDSHVGGLRDASDLVKGARNRLSLRSLLTTAAALAVDDGGSHLPAALRRNPDFADLTIWLLRRLQLNSASADDTALLDQWESRSVDRTDIPAVFDTWTRGRLDMWLADLSQGRASDYPHASPDTPLSAATRRAGEAVGASRLVIANHALLLNVVDQVEQLGDRLLLLVDEAHRIEDAATGAFTAEVTNGQLQRLSRELDAWTAAQLLDDHDARVAATQLDGVLSTEQTVRPAGRLLGAETSSGVRNRHGARATVATGLGVDDATADDALLLLWSHRRLRARVAACYATMAALDPPGDPWQADTYWSLRARLGETVTQLDAILGHLADLLDVDDHDGREAADAAVDPDDADAAAGGGAAANRLVWLTQHPAPRFTGTNWTAFRYGLSSTPVNVGAEADWQRLLSAPATVAMVSATLTVPPTVDGDDRWRFITHRLGLPDSWEQPLRVHSPFDHARQARLVALADFPSWAEQQHGAVLTMVHQLTGYLDEVAAEGRNGAMVLTTSTAAAAETADRLRRVAADPDRSWRVHPATLDGNGPAVDAFQRTGGVLVGTKGLWQGVNIADPQRCRMVWVNKLPFPSFGDPIVTARRQAEAQQADIEGHRDPDHVATGRYYLPLAAIDLKQGVGRLIRSDRHRGVIVISDRKLAGQTRLRRLYRQVFLGALEDGLATPADEPGADQTLDMVDAWRTIWKFLADSTDALDDTDAARLTQPAALDRHVWLPQTLAIRDAALSDEQIDTLRAVGELGDELTARVAAVGAHKDLRDEPLTLRDKQTEVLHAIADGDDVLAVLPTGYGKSLLYQGPGLVLPGVTIVVSPLVSLMQDQAIDLNRTVGGAVRALVAPMRESNSRLGKADVTEQLLGTADHGIRIVHVSPERLGHAQFQQVIARSVAEGICRRIALDEAHTWAAWGDDFRPSFRRAETFIDQLKADTPDLQLLAVTATATAAVRDHLTSTVLARAADAGTLRHVIANPVRPELAVYRRRLTRQAGRRQRKVAALVEQVATNLDGHAIFYATTIAQVEQTHAHLRSLAGNHRLQVLKYHGQMDAVAKNAVLQAFHDAPTDPTDPDFKPTVVVATSAFGLGINRSDIRHVLAISPPTDLAGLYQMLGRGGRDLRRRDPGDWTEPTTAMALITAYNVRILRFMLQRRVHDRHDTITTAAVEILQHGHASDGTAVVNLRDIGDKLRRGDVAAGVLDADDADNSYLVSGYRTLAGRVYASLVRAGAAIDLGDIPRRAAIDPVERPPAEPPETLRLAATVLQAADPLRDDDRGVDLASLWDQLPDAITAEFGDLATMWAELLILHAHGHLDVSQAPNIGHGYATAYRPTASTIPDGLTDTVTAHHAARQDDLQRLLEWFNDDTGCANEAIAAYFTGSRTVPDDTCSHARWACSSCLHHRHPPGDPPPAHDAFYTRAADLEPVAQRQSDRAERQLDRQIVRLLAASPGGLTTNHLQALLAGDPSYWIVSREQYRRVSRTLADHADAGRQPGLSGQRLAGALNRLADGGTVLRTRYRWQHPDHHDDDSDGTAP